MTTSDHGEHVSSPESTVNPGHSDVGAEPEQLPIEVLAHLDVALTAFLQWFLGWGIQTDEDQTKLNYFVYDVGILVQRLVD